GRLYKQFSLTIAFSVAISAFNALSLSPALGALLMRVPPARRFALFRVFNRGFDRFNRAYKSALRRLLRRLPWVALAFGVGLGGTLIVLRSVPTGFVPDEDLNYFIPQIQGPPGASLAYTVDIAQQADKLLRSREEIRDTFAVSGFGFLGNRPNGGIIFTLLRPVAERKGREHSVMAVVNDLRPQLLGIPG